MSSRRALSDAGLLVVRPGLNTTIQDRGREGYRGFGVPVGGAFDRTSLDLANALLGNLPEEAALEMTLVGGSYRAEVSIAMALAGAPMAAMIRAASGSDRLLTIPRSFTLHAGDELVIGGSARGARTYLAVLGGLSTPTVLGSRSTEVRVESGLRLIVRPGSTRSRRPVEWPWAVGRPGEAIRIVDGPDDEATPEVVSRLERHEYRVSARSDRMGLRLEGPAIEASSPADRISAPVAAGAVQLAGGLPIVLGVAGGTMGGYLHLAHVVTADLDRIGQLRPGDPLRFRRIGVEEARRVDRAGRIELARWLAMVRLRQD